jgi:hypothetical protein
MEFGDFKEGHTQKASSYEGVGQLIMQLNQKGDYLSLMIEGVVAVMTEMKERWCHFIVYGPYWWSAEKKSSLFFLVWDID